MYQLSKIKSVNNKRNSKNPNLIKRQILCRLTIYKNTNIYYNQIKI